MCRILDGVFFEVECSYVFFFSSRRRHTRFDCDWSSDVCSSDLYVTAAKAPANISDITDTAGQGIEEIAGLVKDVRAGRGTVGKLMTDERLYTELHAFVVSANDLTSGIRQGRGSVGRLLRDPKAADALEASLKNVEDMT